MHYLQIILFGIFSAIAFGSWIYAALAVFPKNRKEAIGIILMGFIFLWLAGLSWPHHVVTNG